MKCKGKKKDGSPCNRSPSKDSEYCMSHDPAKREEWLEITRRGGKRPARIELIMGNGDKLTRDDLLKITADAIRMTMAGELDPRAGSTLSALLGRQMKLLDSQKEEPLEELTDEELKSRVLKLME